MYLRKGVWGGSRSTRTPRRAAAEGSRGEQAPAGSGAGGKGRERKERRSASTPGLTPPPGPAHRRRPLDEGATRGRRLVGGHARPRLPASEGVERWGLAPPPGADWLEGPLNRGGARMDAFCVGPLRGGGWARRGGGGRAQPRGRP